MLVAEDGRELSQYVQVEPALEGDGKGGQLLPGHPAPRIKFGMLSRKIDVRILSFEQHGEPFLTLPSPPAAPGLSGKRRRYFVIKPCRALGDDFDIVGSDLLAQFAQCR